MDKKWICGLLLATARQSCVGEADIAQTGAPGTAYVCCKQAYMSIAYAW